MKKIISVLIGLSFVVSVLPFTASAQTVDGNQTILTSLLQQLLSLYQSELAYLEQQLATLESNQSAMQTQINNIPSSTVQTVTAGLSDEAVTSTEPTSTSPVIPTSTYTPSQTLTQIQTVSPQVVTSTPVVSEAAPVQPTSTTYNLYSGGLTTFPSSYQYTKLTPALWFQWESCMQSTSSGMIESLLTSGDQIDNSGQGFVTVSTDTTTGATLFSFGPDSLQTVLNSVAIPNEQKTLAYEESSTDPSQTGEVTNTQGDISWLQQITFPISCASGTIEAE